MWQVEQEGSQSTIHPVCLYTEGGRGREGEEEKIFTHFILMIYWLIPADRTPAVKASAGNASWSGGKLWWKYAPH